MLSCDLPHSFGVKVQLIGMSSYVKKSLHGAFFEGPFESCQIQIKVEINSSSRLINNDVDLFPFHSLDHARKGTSNLARLRFELAK